MWPGTEGKSILLLHSEVFFFFSNANVSSGLQAQIIISLLVLLLNAADEIFIYMPYYTASKKLSNCVFVPL